MKRHLQRVLFAAALCASGSAAAQDFPSRPVRTILPAGPGTGVDILVRYVAAKLSERAGWTAVVENRPGGDFNVATQVVLQSPPDGYTMLFGYTALTIQPFTKKDLGYDLQKDLAPVAKVASAAVLLSIWTDVPAKNLAELVAYSKANPGKLNYGITGVGSFSHLAGELIKLQTGLDMLAVNYKDSVAMFTDLATGRIEGGITSIPVTANAIRQGKVRAVITTAAARHAVLPEVPTAAEATGNSELTMGSWYGYFVPARTPRPIIDRLEREILAVVQSAEGRDFLRKQDLDLTAEGADQYRKSIEGDLRRWEKVVKAAKLKFE